MRTTLDIDGSVLEQLKDYQRSRGKSLGAVASELLAKALAETSPDQPPPLEWVSHPMGARVDLHDREAVDRLSGIEYRSTQ
ncbi:antitoxin [Mycobacterium sp.]|uniref:antitoxin n=1 Tax=Mycobacterium sp. TaxID=1785 RepID=UPI0026273DE0|nr:antitoxin [Mycobacterium sp.]